MIVNKKILIWLALVVLFITDTLWALFDVKVYYIGFAFFIFLLSVYIKMINKKSLVSFILLELCFWNLIKELFFNPKEITLSEAIFIFSLPIIYFFRNGSKFN
jgi:hypothetical protein